MLDELHAARAEPIIDRSAGRNHCLCYLTLPLLVPLIGRANHVDASLAADDLAVLANALDARTDFHDRAALPNTSTIPTTRPIQTRRSGSSKGNRFPQRRSPMSNLAAPNLGCDAPNLAGTWRQRERPRLPRDGIGRL